MEKAREMILSSWLLLDSLHLHLCALHLHHEGNHNVPFCDRHLLRDWAKEQMIGISKVIEHHECIVTFHYRFGSLNHHCHSIHLEADNLKDEAHHQGAWACCGSPPPPSRKGRTTRWRTRSVPDRGKIGPRYLKFQNISLGLGEIWSKGAVNNIFKTISSLFPYSPFFFFLCVNRTLVKKKDVYKNQYKHFTCM